MFIAQGNEGIGSCASSSWNIVMMSLFAFDDIILKKYIASLVEKAPAGYGDSCTCVLARDPW